MTRSPTACPAAPSSTPTCRGRRRSPPRLGIADFAVPHYGGPLDGLPLNLESLVRQPSRRVRRRHQPLREAPRPARAPRHRRRQRGLLGARRRRRSARHRRPLRQPRHLRLGPARRPATTPPPGRRRRRALPQHDDLLGAKPAHDNDIAAHSVLAPFGIDATQVGAAAWHGANGGIDTLIVALGSNNALDAVVSKDVSVVGRRLRRPRREGRVQRLDADPLRPGVRPARRRAQRDPGPPCRVGDRAARDDRADRQGREP